MKPLIKSLCLLGPLMLAMPQMACAEMRALLVGVSGYPTLANHQLNGPRNDVQRMKAVLEQRGFARDQITVLADGVTGAKEPTRSRIMQALDALAASAKKGDTIMLYFAGHGSQQPVVSGSAQAAQESDGLHEIFLPIDIGGWDGEIGGVKNAIVDYELRAAVDKIQDRGAFVWGVFDACHSATMVRGVDDEVRYRTVQPKALGVPQKALDAAIDKARQDKGAEGRSHSAMDATAASTKAGRGEAVFFYAAQTTEQTPEMPLPQGAPDRQPYGLFGFMLSRALELGQPMTYRQMGQYVMAQYAGMNEARATPLFTGTALDEPVLGQPALPVRQWPLNKDKMSVPVGAVAGVSADAIFAVLPSPVAKDRDIVGYVQAKSVQLSASELEPVAYGGKPALKPEDIKPGWYVRLVSSPERYVLRVAVDAKDCGVTCAWLPVVARVKAQGVPGTNIEWVSTGADVTLKLRKDRVQVLSPSEVLSCRPDVSKDLCSPDRIGTTLLTLGNEGTGEIDLARTTGALSTALHGTARATNLLRLGARLSAQSQTTGVPVSVARTGKAVKKPQGITAETIADLRNGDALTVTLSNKGQMARDVTVLYVDAHYGIQVMFPRGGESNRLEAGAVQSLDIDIDDSSAGVERLLVISVEAEKFGERADFSFLEQPSLASVRSRNGPVTDDILAFMDAGYADYITRAGKVRVPSVRTGMQVFTFNVK
jgi:Caspase domain